MHEQQRNASEPVGPRARDQHRVHLLIGAHGAAHVRVLVEAALPAEPIELSAPVPHQLGHRGIVGARVPAGGEWQLWPAGRVQASMQVVDRTLGELDAERTERHPRCLIAPTAAILDRLREVCSLDDVGARQIGDRARDLEHAVERAG